MVCYGSFRKIDLVLSSFWVLQIYFFIVDVEENVTSVELLQNEITYLQKKH